MLRLAYSFHDSLLSRTIPFETKRPLVDEVRRVWDRLGSVACHGPMKEFLEERLKRKQRAKVLAKKKRVETQWRPEDGDEKEKTPSKERKVRSEMKRHSSAVEPLMDM